MVLRLCKDLDIGNTEVEGAGAVELDPLAEVEFGMLMAVLIRLGQGMVDFERGRKRSEGQQHCNQRSGSEDPQYSEPGQCRTIIGHKRRHYPIAVIPCQRMTRAGKAAPLLHNRNS